MMDIFAQLALRIIKEQENIIGPIAMEQAKKVPGLKVDWDKHQLTLEGNQTEIIEHLIESYQHFFGHASVEVCREAVRHIIAEVPRDRIPRQLQ
jgi:hypothetical protein